MTRVKYLIYNNPYIFTLLYIIYFLNYESRQSP